MPMLNVNGRSVQVDDSFLKLSPDEQNKTVDEIAKSIGPMKPPVDVSMAGDVAKSAGIGLAKGTIGLAGSMGDFAHIIGDARDRYLANPISRALGLKEVNLDAPDPAEKIGSAAIQHGIEGYTGEFYKPQTTAGKYASTAAEFVPGAIAMGGGNLAALPGNIIRGAILPGVASEAAGQLTQGTSGEHVARVAAALTAAGGAGRLNRVVTPLPASPVRQQMVDALAGEGVTSLTAGQRTGSPALRYMESILGDGPGAGGQASRVQRQGQEQFTEAAMRRAGAGPDASPEVLAANNQRLGQTFEDLSARNNLIPDNQFINDLTTAVNRYRNVPESQQARMLQGYLDDIVPHVNNGAMPGTQYQPMRSILSADSKSVRGTDPYLSRALAGMRDALDNAMARSINPEDAQAWQAARREYSAQKVLEKTASRAGELTAEGQITPANLRNTVAAENRGAYARGQGQFSELARAGAAVMSPLPNSGTAQRMFYGDLAKLPLTAIGGRVLMSRPVQAYLGNQLLPEIQRSRVEQIARLLLTSRGAAPQLESNP